jgi:hypothetical protein
MQLQYPKTTQALEIIGEAVVKEMGQRLIRANKNASGRLYNSLDYNVELFQGKPTLSVSWAKHGEYVRRMPHFKRMPPVQAIEDWLKVKKIPIGRGRVSSVSGKNLKKQSRAKELRSLAWAIAMKIKKRGTLHPSYTPVDFLEPFTSWKTKRVYQQGLVKALKEDIQNNLWK